MMIRFCKDCANFEDRRDIEGVCVCTKNHEPHICCEQFDPKESVKGYRLYNMFFSQCISFEDINDTPICKNNYPGIACDEFVERIRELQGTNQKNLMKTTLLVYALNTSFNPIPNNPIKIAVKYNNDLELPLEITII
jgi:hypothetical protein